MGWRTVVIREHSKLTYKNNHLIFKSAFRVEAIYLPEIDILLLETTDITLTTMLIKRLVDENILVIFCDDKHLPVAKLWPYYGRHDSSLQLSKQLNWATEVKQEVWTQIIEQKIYNQGRFLHEQGYQKQERALANLADKLMINDPSNREGHAARLYFNTLFGVHFSRSQDTVVNAGLDYGYTLLMSVFAREIACAGCLTQLGLKHSNQFNDFNLASDLMEPFRILVDQIVVEHQQDDFLHLKHALFSLFTNTYTFNHQSMYLSNIASDYTKKVIKELNTNGKGVPDFRI